MPHPISNLSWENGAIIRSTIIHTKVIEWCNICFASRLIILPSLSLSHQIRIFKSHCNKCLLSITFPKSCLLLALIHMSIFERAFSKYTHKFIILWLPTIYRILGFLWHILVKLALTETFVWQKKSWRQEKHFFIFDQNYKTMYSPSGAQTPTASLSWYKFHTKSL